MSRVEQSLTLIGDLMVSKKQQWRIGDVFTVETSDGMHVVGQIIGQEPVVLNSVSVAFFDIRVKESIDAELIELDSDKIFSIVFSTRDLLDAGKWKVTRHSSVKFEPYQLPYEHLRPLGFVGAKVIGSGILEEFLNAFYSLTPWDNWKDSDYLDRLLIDHSKKPKCLIYKKLD